MSPEERPKTYIQITGVGYYENSENSTETFDEDSQKSGYDFFAKLVRDWEAAARLKPETNVRQVFVRSGVVLGREGGMIERIYWPFYMGTGGVMGSGSQPMPWIHIHDLTGIIIHAVENEKANGVLNGVAPDLITNQQFVQVLFILTIQF